jgi:hypothetical protein
MTASFTVETTVSDNSPYAPNWALEKDLNGKVTAKDFIIHFREGHVAIDREVLKDEQSRGFDKNPRVRTDSRLDKPAHLVKPFGRIQHFARVASLEAIKEMYQRIVELSPTDTGQYISANYVFYNTRLVARSYAELVAWLKFASKRGFKDSDKIRFMNVMPYAAPLEQKGVTRNKQGRNTHKTATKLSKAKKNVGKGIRVSRPNGVYYRAYRNILRKFKGVGKVKFAFLPNGSGGISVLEEPPFRTSYKRTGLPYVYPTITLFLSEKGIL